MSVFCQKNKTDTYSACLRGLVFGVLMKFACVCMGECSSVVVDRVCALRCLVREIQRAGAMRGLVGL